MERYFKNCNEILVVTQDVVGIANLYNYYYKDEDGLQKYKEGYYDLKNKCAVDFGEGYGVRWGTSEIFNKEGDAVDISEVEEAIIEGVFIWDGHNHKFIELVSDSSEYEEVDVDMIEDKIVYTEYKITTGSKKLQKIRVDDKETYAVYCTATAYEGDWCNNIYTISDSDAEQIIGDGDFSSFCVK